MKDNTLNEALITASREGNLQEVETLVKYGADSLDFALEMASICKHTDIMAFLVKQGAVVYKITERTKEDQRLDRAMLFKTVNIKTGVMYRFYDDGRIEGLGEGWATMFNDTVILEKMIAYH